MKAMHCLLLLSFLIPAANALAGNEGSGGHSLQNEIYHRAEFGAYKLRKDRLVSDDLLKVIDEAVAELSVDAGENIVGTCEVSPDAERPGKRAVFYSPAELRLDLANDEVDLIALSLHEAFQTK